MTRLDPARRSRGTFCGRTRREFLWEAGGAFTSVALSGLLIGTLTGVVLGGLVLQTSFPEVAPGSAEAVPWLTIVGIVVAAYLFSLLTTIVPVWQATRIYPAEALRYE